MTIDVRPSHHARQGVAYAELGLGVNARSGFVQNQEARIVRQRPRETDQLLLPGGKAAAALSDFVAKPFRQSADEIEQVHLFGGLGDFLLTD